MSKAEFLTTLVNLSSAIGAMQSAMASDSDASFALAKVAFLEGGAAVAKYTLESGELVADTVNAGSVSSWAC